LNHYQFKKLLQLRIGITDTFKDILIPRYHMFCFSPVLLILLVGWAAAFLLSNNDHALAVEDEDIARVANVLIEDSIQALNANDTSEALKRLDLVLAQLQATNNNSTSFMTGKVFVEDALSALESGDESSAIYRLGLAQQGLASNSTAGK